MDKALFTSVPQSDFSTVSNNEHEHYLAEIKRIRNEIAGFRPIETTDKPSKNVTKVPPKVATKPVNNKTRPLGGNTAVKTTAAGYKRAVYYWRVTPSSWQLPIYSHWILAFKSCDEVRLIIQLCGRQKLRPIYMNSHSKFRHSIRLYYPITYS